MTRPKVPPEQRQRTAQACESCKRRKQKCNGLCPCNTCEKRQFTCIYTERDDSSPPDTRLSKKRAMDDGDLDSLANDMSSTNTPSNGLLNMSPQPIPVYGSPLNLRRASLATPQAASDAKPSVEAPSGSVQQFASRDAATDPPTFLSRGTTVHSGDEEAVIYTQSRMLQDPTGRMLYVGDSATLSFLQLLRMMVESSAGTSPFTDDPRRHKIVEGQFSLPAGSRHTHLLPDQRTARVLVDAFFINTHGFLQIFEHQQFSHELERCYSDPLSTEPSWLCILNLVFAIGLTMATPLSGSPDAIIIEKLRSEHLDRAEVFYLNAKNLNDPMTGLEDQDFWSVQALLLMSVYMLAKSKRNAAFALLGMAARSAYALGLHREETMVIFSPEEQAARRNLWRSIFVVDRLLSCSLGRPTAISEDDCSGDTLHPPQPSPDIAFNPSTKPTFNDTGACALEAVVRSCSVIGIILRKVYQQRKISTNLAQEIADICKDWPRALPSVLHWRQAANASSSQGVAILHANLFYCHSIILLTRPFFLYILNMETQRQVSQAANGNQTPRPYIRMEKFSEACVIASTHTILLVHNAFEAGHLSRRNPAVIYFLFAAALVILANEFAGLYRVETSDTCILNAITIMGYCAESDPQASRLVYIMSSFRDVVAAQRTRRKQSQNQADSLSLPSISAQLYGVPMSSQMLGLGAQDYKSTPTPHLHQVPVHIYPGMQTAPVPNDTTAPYQNQNLSQPHQHPSFSVHLSPMQNSTDPFTLNSQLSKLPSLSHMLDLSALDSTRVPNLLSEDGAGQDEHIDFDALWAWPSNTPAIGTPQLQGDGGMNINVMDRMQGVSDSAVPLFSVVSSDTPDV